MLALRAGLRVADPDRQPARADLDGPGPEDLGGPIRLRNARGGVVRGTATDITGSASGVVRGDNATGPVVADATVEVLKAGTTIDNTDDANIVATGKTDANGAFKFAFLLPGTYVLRATPPTGSVYKPALLSGGFSVTTGQETTGLNVILGR